nr:hypothetical protein [Halorubrum laminariae]
MNVDVGGHGVSALRHSPCPPARRRRERKVRVDLVVPHDGALRAAVLFELKEAVVRQLVHVVENLRWVPVNKASEFTDTLRLVCNDCFEEFEVGRPKDATERLEVLDRQCWLAGFDVVAGVDRFEPLLEFVTIRGLDLDRVFGSWCCRVGMGLRSCVGLRARRVTGRFISLGRSVASHAQKISLGGT